MCGGKKEITISRGRYKLERVEVYHIIFEVIRHKSPKTFELIKKWYSSRLKKGLDPTWHIPEAFAERMVQEEEFPGSTDLPRRAANHIGKFQARFDKFRLDPENNDFLG